MDISLSLSCLHVQVRYVFCFDKMLLICKQTRGDHYSYKEGLKIKDYKVQDVTSRLAVQIF